MVLTKEDLIGTKQKCSYQNCRKEIEVTRDGIEHLEKDHWFKFSLEELFFIHSLNRDFYRQLLYGSNKPEKEEDSFYFVNLSNKDDSIHTFGKKSRKTMQIYLIDDNYEVDKSKPLESTEFHYVRDSTTFDL